MKALRKCLKTEVETSKQQAERLSELEIALQSKEETLSSLQMNN